MTSQDMEALLQVQPDSRRLFTTVGIELELASVARARRDNELGIQLAARALVDAGHADWAVKYDASCGPRVNCWGRLVVNRGLEVVSPIISKWGDLRKVV